MGKWNFRKIQYFGSGNFIQLRNWTFLYIYFIFFNGQPSMDLRRASICLLIASNWSCRPWTTSSSKDRKCRVYHYRLYLFIRTGQRWEFIKKDLKRKSMKIRLRPREKEDLKREKTLLTTKKNIKRKENTPNTTMKISKKPQSRVRYRPKKKAKMKDIHFYINSHLGQEIRYSL